MLNVRFEVGSAEYDAVRDWECYPMSFTVGGARAKLRTINIPYRDGLLYVNESFGGGTHYENRTIEIPFLIMAKDHATMHSAVANILNGKKAKIYLSTDSEWYYYGYVHVDSYYSSGWQWQFVMTIDAEPYKNKSTSHFIIDSNTFRSILSYKYYPSLHRFDPEYGMNENPVFSNVRQTTLVRNKNLLPYFAVGNATDGGITWVDNGDGTYTMSGTSSVSYGNYASYCITGVDLSNATAATPVSVSESNVAILESGYYKFVDSTMGTYEYLPSSAVTKMYVEITWGMVSDDLTAYNMGTFRTSTDIGIDFSLLSTSTDKKFAVSIKYLVPYNATFSDVTLSPIIRCRELESPASRGQNLLPSPCYQMRKNKTSGVENWDEYISDNDIKYTLQEDGSLIAEQLGTPAGSDVWSNPIYLVKYYYLPFGTYALLGAEDEYVRLYIQRCYDNGSTSTIYYADGIEHGGHDGIFVWDDTYTSSRIGIAVYIRGDMPTGHKCVIKPRLINLNGDANAPREYIQYDNDLDTYEPYFKKFIDSNTTIDEDIVLNQDRSTYFTFSGLLNDNYMNAGNIPYVLEVETKTGGKSL